MEVLGGERNLLLKKYLNSSIILSVIVPKRCIMLVVRSPTIFTRRGIRFLTFLIQSIPPCPIICEMTP